MPRTFFIFFIQMEMTKIVVSKWVLNGTQYMAKTMPYIVRMLKSTKNAGGGGVHPHYLTYRSIFVGHYEGAFNCNLVVLRVSVIYSHRRLLK